MEDRNLRNTRQGEVVSASMDKTVVVKVVYRVKDSRIGKVVQIKEI